MGKNTFVDRKLVNIREKLKNEPEANETALEKTVEKSSEEPSPQKRQKRTLVPAASVNINDKEWKRALFERWDEFKALRRDVRFKVQQMLENLPENRRDAEEKMKVLTSAEARLTRVIAEVEAIDDSTWDRHSLSSQLSAAMRTVENSRMEIMIISAKLADSKSVVPEQGGGTTTVSSFIHELRSLSFRQSFKLGLGFFFPLIIGIIVAALILAIFNYLTLL